MYALGRLFSFLPRETISLTSCLLSITLQSFEKETYTKRKEFTPQEQILFLGSGFSPLIVDPYGQGKQNIYDRVAFPADVSISHYSVVYAFKLN